MSQKLNPVSSALKNFSRARYFPRMTPSRSTTPSLTWDRPRASTSARASAAVLTLLESMGFKSHQAWWTPFPPGGIVLKKSSCLSGRADLAQNLVTCGDECVGIVFREAQWRTNFQRIAVGTGRADQNAALTKPVDEQTGDLWRRFLCIAITNELEADEQSGAAYVTDLDVSIADLAQPVHDVTADDPCVFDQSLVRDDIEHGEPGCRGHRIATECIEVLHLRDEPVEQRRAGCNAAHRKAIAHRFPHAHDVRHDIMPRETPQRRAGPPKSRLDFVGNEQTPAVMHAFDGGREKARRIGI